VEARCDDGEGGDDDGEGDEGEGDEEGDEDEGGADDAATPPMKLWKGNTLKFSDRKWLATLPPEQAAAGPDAAAAAAGEHSLASVLGNDETWRLLTTVASALEPPVNDEVEDADVREVQLYEDYIGPDEDRKEEEAAPPESTEPAAEELGPGPVRLQLAASQSGCFSEAAMLQASKALCADESLFFRQLPEGSAQLLAQLVLPECGAAGAAASAASELVALARELHTSSELLALAQELRAAAGKPHFGQFMSSSPETAGFKLALANVGCALRGSK
jgi:hypothetical protein